MRTSLLLTLLLGLVESLPAGARSPAQGANLSGEWVFSVNMARSNFEETFVLIQEGEKLTGTYKGEFGEKTITGTVKGNQVVVVVEVVRERRNVKATYTGTIENAGQMGCVPPV